MAGINWIPYNDFAVSQSSRLKPSEEYQRAYGGGEGSMSAYSPLIDYQMQTGNSVTQTDPAYRNWLISKVTGGQTPEQYIQGLNAGIGLGPKLSGVPGSGGYWYDPKTGQVGTQNFDESTLASFAPLFTIGGMALGAGALSGAMAGTGAAAAGAGGLSGADVAAGLVPEYGTTAAYNAGVGLGGSGVDMTGFINDPFSFTADPTLSYGNLSGYNVGDFTNSMMPSGNLSASGNGMIDLGAGTTGAIPGAGLDASGWNLGNMFSPSNIGSAVKGLFGGSGTGNSNYSGLGALLGALAGGVGANRKPAGTTTTVQDLPDWLKPYAAANLNAGSNVLSQGTGTPLLPQAQDELSKTISGAYLNPATNPYLQNTYNQAAKAVTDSYLSTTQPRTDALFNNAGAFGPGNSAYAETVARNQFGLGQNLQNLATNIFGGNYNTERGRQFGAATAAPDFTTSSYQARFSPFSSFGSLMPSGVRSTSSPYFTNPMGGALSGALGGYALGKAFGG